MLYPLALMASLGVRLLPVALPLPGVVFVFVL